MNKFSDCFYKNIYKIFMVCIGVLVVLPILAPILKHLNITIVADVIFKIYSFFCHQIHWRSFHLFDVQFAWCSRCTMMWATIFITGIILNKYKVKGIKWYWLIIFALPMALDGIIQTIATIIGVTNNSEIFYISNNFIRSLTGMLFGIGFGLWFWNIIDDMRIKDNRKTISMKKAIIHIFVIAFFVLITLLFLWNITSTVNKPIEFFDFAVKIPVSPQDFLKRGLNK